MADRRKTYTDAEKAEALKLYETDGTSAASKVTGIPKSTIDHWAKVAGVRTARTPKTEAATRASAADAAATRQLVASKTISAADKAVTALLDRLDTEATDMPMKDLATVYGILADKHVILARIDTVDDHDDAKSVIGDLVKGLAEDYERRHQ